MHRRHTDHQNHRPLRRAPGPLLNAPDVRRAAVAFAVPHACEMLEPRMLLSGSISGQVWNDLNGNGAHDGGEPGLSGWVVYLDQNRNRVRDADETWTTTDGTGAYSFPALDPDQYNVAEEAPVGWSQTYPGASGIQAGITASSPSGAESLQPGNASYTYTGSTVPAEILGEPVAAPVGSDVSVVPSDVESNQLINLNAMRSDPRFAGIDGHGYSVAILDTGIDLNHPFFGPDADNNGVADRIVYQHDFADNDNDASDVNGHGSNVASIAAGSDATYSGMAPGANIIALKVFSDSGSGLFSYIEQALQWCVANAATYNIAAVNMSLGDSQNWATSQQLYGISDELAALAAKNVIVVSAAGNDYFSYQTQGVSYPAADPNSLAVGAVYDANVGGISYANGARDNTTAADRIASFSQRSTALLDVFAPGAIITGANATGGLSSYTGTSQASPHIAGLAVLAQQLAVQLLGRRLTPSEFTDVLRNSAVTINDGDDENDNVVNTGADYPRVDALGLASAIYDLGANSYPYGYSINLADGTDSTDDDFGVEKLNPQPGQPSLSAASDTGVSSSDRLTSFDNSSPATRLSFTVPGTHAGATLNLYADGQRIATTPAADGTTPVTTNGTLDLADGAHAITARQVFPGQAESVDSPSLTITVDTVAPAPAVFTLDPASDTGISNSDKLTRLGQPVFDVQGTPYYYITWNGTALDGYETAPTFQPWWTLTDGTQSFTAYGLDAAGNVSTPRVETITVDTVAWQPQPIFDPTFGNAGATVVPGTTGQAAQVIQQPDGKILVAGYTSGANFQYNLELVRLNANGTVDTSFGSGGVVTAAPGYRNQIDAIVLQPDGKILVAGRDDAPSGLYSAFIARWNPNGTPDATFAGGGIFTLPPSTLVQAFDVALLDDGRFLVGGYSTSNGGDFAVARFLPSGSFDTTFGTGGTATVDFGNYNFGQAMALTPDGRIVLAGYTQVPSGFDMGVARLLANGALDPSFDLDGRVTLHVGVQSTFANAVAVQPDGKIVVAGSRDDANSSDAQNSLIARFNTNGSLDATFGTAGVVVQSLSTNYERWEDIFLQPDGKIVATGVGSGYFEVGRILASGAPDASFGTSGLVSYQPAGETAAGHGGALQGDGKILVVGTIDNGVNGAFGVIRLNPGVKPTSLVLSAASDSGVSNSDGITNVNTPQFAVPGMPADVYFRVYRNGTQIGPDYQSGTNYTPATQPDGTWDYTYLGLDAAGNASDFSTPLTITIDTVAPAAPSAPDLDAASDTGGDSADDLTSATSLSFNVAGSPYFRLYRNGSLASGSYESGAAYALPAVQSPGVWSYGLSAVDAAGNESPKSPSLLVTIVSATAGSAFQLTRTSGGSTLSVTAGSVTLPPADLSLSYLGLSLSASGGSSVLLNSAQHFSALTLVGASTATAAGALTVGGLSIDPTSALDLQTSDLLADRLATPASTIRSYLTSGYANNTWTGPGIRSGTAASDPSHFSLGYADGGVNSDAPPGQVLVRYTRRGDANLDHNVDIQDLLRFRANAGTPTPAQWWQADFTYDGKVDIQDLLAFRANAGMSAPEVVAAAASTTTSSSSSQPDLPPPLSSAADDQKQLL